MFSIEDSICTPGIHQDLASGDAQMRYGMFPMGYYPYGGAMGFYPYGQMRMAPAQDKFEKVNAKKQENKQSIAKVAVIAGATILAAVLLRKGKKAFNSPAVKELGKRVKDFNIVGKGKKFLKNISKKLKKLVGKK